MRKKIVSIAIASLMAMTAVGCGNKAAEAPAEVQEEQVAEVEAEAEEDAAEVDVAADDTQEAAEVAAAEDTTETEEVTEVVEETTDESTEEVAEETPAEEVVEEVTVEETTEEASVEESKEEAKVEEKPAVTIPDWFDATYYAANNSDVVAAVGSSAEALFNHYTAHGKSEGRAAYEGDPNATARVADNQTEGTTQEGQGGTTSTESTSTDELWWKSLPEHQWIDMGTFFICIAPDKYYPSFGEEYMPIITERTGRRATCGGPDTAIFGYSPCPDVDYLCVYPWGDPIN